MLTRRQFVKAALLAGTAAAVPPVLDSFLTTARAASGTQTAGFFLDAARWSTCKALCARIVPTGADPATDPGATEAKAVVFVDRFLSAFDMPATGLADNPAIWLRGRWSGRNPVAGQSGYPTNQYPPDDFLDSHGTAHFLGLTPIQTLSWRYQLYGESALQDSPAWAAGWAKQVGTLIPSPTPAGGLRQAYKDGLDAFDSYSQSMFGTPYAEANTEEQDIMLAAAGNVLLNAVASNFPVAPPSPPAAPPAASALFPIITLHTFQATYGLPEYTWRNQDNDPTIIPLEGTAQWRAIGYDGDTEPLGNSLFDENMYGPGEGPNEGFGAPPASKEAKEGVFVPFGGYREFRPVSTLEQGGVVLGTADAQLIQQALDAGKKVAK